MENNDYQKLKSSVESLLFVSGEGLSLKDICLGVSIEMELVETIINSLIDDYHERDGGIFIKEVNGKYQFITRPESSEVIQKYLQIKKKNTLSKSMMETLAIITYKQPITLHEIDEIRGISSRSIISGLSNRKLIKINGQKNMPGKPSTYGTTKEFLEYFGINSLKELPPPKDIKTLNFDEF